MKMNRRILIVDDREDLRKQLSRLLSHSDSKSETSSLIQQIRNRISPDKDPADNGQRVTYEIDAASSPTRITPSPGVAPRTLRASTSAFNSARISAAISFPDMTFALRTTP